MSIEQAAHDYVALRRSLGYKLTRDGRLLSDFGRFLDTSGHDHITRELAVRWATREGRTPRPAAAKRLSIVRQFARHLGAVEPRTEVPEAALLPHSNTRPQPYIYSDADIAVLLHAAGALKPFFRAQTYTTLLGLVAVLGLRIGEAIRLDCADVDVPRRRITIRKSKFGKSRVNLLHDTTVTVLERYSQQRRQHQPSPQTNAFFVSGAGTRLFYSNVHKVFLDDLLPMADLVDCRPRPRIHDLRHTVAVRTLVDWYRRGENVAARLPALSAWLGHTCPSNTYWYLSATPELMGCAVDRLEQHWEGER